MNKANLKGESQPYPPSTEDLGSRKDSKLWGNEYTRALLYLSKKVTSWRRGSSLQPPIDTLQIKRPAETRIVPNLQTIMVGVKQYIA